MTREVYGLFGMVLTGAALSCVFDLSRTMHRVFKIPGAIFDLLFWLFASVSLSAVLIYFNNGRIRGYEVIGTIIGAVLYFLTISPLVIRGFTVIFKIFLKILQYILKILLTPARFLYKILYSNIKSKKKGNMQ